MQLAEMVNLHFLSLLESLLECNSSVFSRLLPLWNPVLYAHHGQVYQAYYLIGKGIYTESDVT